MATTTRIAAILAALADGLAAREALTGVQVSSAYLGDEMSGQEFICLDGDHLLNGDWAAFGRLSRVETVTLRGSVVVRRPGAGEDVVRELRARVVELFGEIEGYLVESAIQNRLSVDADGDGTFTPTVNTSKIRPVGYGDRVDVDGRIGVLAFEVECESRLTAT